MQLNVLRQGVMGHVLQRKGHEQCTLWTVFQVESQQPPRYLPLSERIRLYARYQTFLEGLGFPLKFLDLVERCHPDQDEALLAQEQALATLAVTPHLQTLLEASLSSQRTQARQARAIRHFLVVSASSREVAQARQSTSPHLLNRLFSSGKPGNVSKQQVLDLLRIRVSVVEQALGQLDVRARLLDDVAALSAYVSSLALGAHTPSFTVEVGRASTVRASKGMDEATIAKPGPPTSLQMIRPHDPEQTEREIIPHQQLPAPSLRRRWPKRVKGLHGSCSYLSSNESNRLEANLLHLPDLLAPSSMRILPEAVAITANNERRFQRSFEVTGYAASLTCGWMEEITNLGLPMAIMTRCEPINTAFMVRRLEFQLTRLESQRLADGKARRLTRASQEAEAETIRTVIAALVRKQLSIFAVQVVITIHAASLQSLEQRSSWLLTHLQEMQLQMRALSRRHDIGWQATLLSGLPVGLDFFKNLGSDVLSTFMNWNSGRIGMSTGAYLGTTGSGQNRRAVYFNPWESSNQLANPHVVVVGETGMGKSWLVKMLMLGILGIGVADVVVLDRDGDYDEIHTHLGPQESQRISLSRGCPINPLSIPYGPDDVDAQDSNLLAEFIDNSVLVFLSMLLTDQGFSRTEEAFVAQTVRACYATKGFTDERIAADPAVLLTPAPVFVDLIAAMRAGSASSQDMRQSFIERMEQVAHLFPSQDTTITLTTPLTIFSIKALDEKWYPLMIYVIENFLRRHRALKRHERYLAYVIEEASYMFRHPAAKRYLEAGSRGFRKQGIAQVVISQLPRDFLEEGQVILNNAGTAFFLGMQRYAVEKLGLPEELERVLLMGTPGQAVMRCGRAYAQLSVASIPALRAILTTDPEERRRLAQHQSQRDDESRFATP